MSPFVEQLITEFTQQRSKDDLDKQCLAAEEAILKFRNTGEGTPAAVKGLTEANITAADVTALTRALKWFIERHPRHQSVGSAIWALAALNDSSLAPFFLAQIRFHYSNRSLHPVQQADNALCRLGLDYPQYDYAPGEKTDEGYWAAVEAFLRRHPNH